MLPQLTQILGVTLGEVRDVLVFRFPDGPHVFDTRVMVSVLDEAPPAPVIRDVEYYLQLTPDEPWCVCVRYHRKDHFWYEAHQSTRDPATLNRLDFLDWHARTVEVPSWLSPKPN